ncbi:hypothetical protein SK128_028375 [Halocaridina rubra]|uniref:Uncharacterized protein n=1 Tax=Halocaridina rubra TaxID=373956 RepID=A0AAN8XI70_HALRR
MVSVFSSISSISKPGYIPVDSLGKTYELTMLHVLHITKEEKNHKHKTCWLCYSRVYLVIRKKLYLYIPIKIKYINPKKSGTKEHPRDREKITSKRNQTAKFNISVTNEKQVNL